MKGGALLHDEVKSPAVRGTGFCQQMGRWGKGLAAHWLLLLLSLMSALYLSMQDVVFCILNI